MEERTWTSDLALRSGGPVLLKGWLHRLRVLSTVTFLVLRDARGLAQVVVTVPALRSALNALHCETVLEVRGEAVAVPKAPNGVEVHAPRVTVVARTGEPPPLELFRPELNASLPSLLDHAAVSLRHPRRRGHFEMAAAALRGFRSTLDSQGFIEVNSPKIVSSTTEGGANVFTVDYFGRTAYLAQSPQFYKQTLVGVFERVYEVGPVFRAEPHDTARHINEYVSLDAEFGFIEDHRTVMALMTRLLGHVVSALALRSVQDRRWAAEIGLLGLRLPEVPETIPQIGFGEAQELLSERYGQDCRGEPDLAPQHERLLGEWAHEAHGSEFLFVTGYPMVKRPFYTHPDPADPTASNSFDLIFRGMELVTGGQRLHRYADYIEALASRGLPTEPFAAYLEVMRYGMPPHGGFAIGLERFVMQLAGLGNVREATLFPRDLARLAP